MTDKWMFIKLWDWAVDDQRDLGVFVHKLSKVYILVQHAIKPKWFSALIMRFEKKKESLIAIVLDLGQTIPGGLQTLLESLPKDVHGAEER